MLFRSLAIKHNVVERPNNQSYVFKGEIIARGKDNFYEVVEQDNKLQETLLNLVKEVKTKNIPQQTEKEQN